MVALVVVLENMQVVDRPRCCLYKKSYQFVSEFFLGVRPEIYLPLWRTDPDSS